MPYWKNLFSTGYINPDGDRDVDAAQSSLIVSILSAGTFFGALTAAPAADFLGRKLGLVACNVVFCVGVILQTIATDIPVFVAGRFFAGYGVGMISATIPLYQSETAPKWIRGVIVGAYQLAITIGILLANIVNNSTKDRNDTGSYRIPIAVQFAWAIILFVGCIWLPETPRWYIRKGKPEAAAKSLSVLRRLDMDHPAVVEELAEITANHEYELSLGKATYIDCFKGNLGRRLATGCLLQALQQLTGVNFIFYYGTSFFQRAGFREPFIISMITSSVNVASTLPGLYLVEKWGRRNLLLFGAVGMAVCQFIVAITGTVAGVENQAAQNALVAFVCIYIFFFACSWGPVAWVVTGEIFPLKVRAKSLSMTSKSLEQPPRLVLYANFPFSRIQLAPQLRYRIRYSLHGQRWPRKRQPWSQGLLRLGRVLLHLHLLRLGNDLRDQGFVSRAGRRALRQGQQSLEVTRLCSYRLFPGRSGCCWRQPP
jgi:SP family sugar:H+ symporter-like MFS transporter